MEVKRTYPVPSRGVGRPDYSTEVAKGKQVLAYGVEPDESLLWLCTICLAVAGPSVITRGPLAPAATMWAINCENGANFAAFPAGVDYVIKEFWVSFNEPVEFRMFQGGSFNDVSCLGFFPASSKPVNLFQLGWSRSLLEDINVASELWVSITNLGVGNALGKVWCEGFYKTGSYLWM